MGVNLFLNELEMNSSESFRVTGCRYSELRPCTLQISMATPAFSPLPHRRLPRHVVFGGGRQTAICEVDSRQAAGGFVFTRTDGGQWRKSHQIRPMLDACRRAKINPAVSFHTLRHTHGSTLAMRGAPMAVIADQLGHAETRMTEKHYAHLAPNYVADTIRACFPRLGIAGRDNVIPISTQR
jgi:site-specific recombinase XerC